MLKSVTLIALATLLSVSIVGPSFLALLDTEADIEIVQDFEEESQKDAKKEIEEGEKFFNDIFPIAIAYSESKDALRFFYNDRIYGHVADVNCPPPRA